MEAAGKRLIRDEANEIHWYVIFLIFQSVCAPQSQNVGSSVVFFTADFS